MAAYSGLKQVGMFEARVRWSRLTNAIARYIAGPHPTADDLHDAAETIGDYMVWRATAPTDTTTIAMRTAITNAISNR